MQASDRHWWGLGMAIAMLLAVTACTTPDRVTRTYQGPLPDDAPFDTFLVVDLSTNATRRREAEDRLVAELAEGYRTVTPSHHLIGFEAPMVGSQIAAAAKEAAAQAVLVTRVESISTEYEKLVDRADVKVTCRRGNPVDLFLYDYEELAIPDEVVFKQQVVLIANLYSADDGAHLWGIRSECFDQASVNDALSRHANNIVSELNRAGLIR